MAFIHVSSKSCDICRKNVDPNFQWNYEGSEKIWTYNLNTCEQCKRDICSDCSIVGRDEFGIVFMASCKECNFIVNDEYSQLSEKEIQEILECFDDTMY